MGNGYNSFNDKLRVIVTLSFLLTVISIRLTFSHSIKRKAETTSSNVNNYDSSEEMSVPRRPKITGELVEDILLESGKLTTSLECKYEGNPTPQIIWLKNSKNVPATHEVKNEIQQGKTSLQIPENEIIVDEKKTNYSCIAANFLGSAMKSFIIYLLPRPPEEQTPPPKKGFPWW